MGPGNQVKGNYIGTSASGMAKVPNGFGVQISRGWTDTLNGSPSPDTLIGGTSPGEGNVISGNYFGILLNTSGTRIQGNAIGVGADGKTPLGNLHMGIQVEMGTTDNLLGGTAPGAGNIIAHSGHAGVYFFDFGKQSIAAGNSIRGNSIYANQRLGIWLGGSEDKTNDIGDGDSGPNGYQNSPRIKQASIQGSNTSISGFLQSAPLTRYEIEIFGCQGPSVLGHGEGETVLGSLSVTTNSQGAADFASTLPVANAYVSATATNMVTGDTSEFSPAVPRVYAPTLTNMTPKSGMVGTVVSLSGTNLGNASEVKIGGVPVNFKIVSPQRIEFTVPPPAKSGLVTLVTPGGLVTSADVFTITLPSLSIGDIVMREGNNNADSFYAVFPVALEPVSTQVVTVKYTVSNGTARFEDDYTTPGKSLSGTLTFAPGQTSQSILVRLNGDFAVEADETYFVRLSSPVKATLAKAQGIGTLLNDDQKTAPIVTIATPTKAAILPKITLISGSVSDGNGSGIAKIEIEVRRNSDKLYWTGTSWGAKVRLPIDALSGGRWVKTSGLPPAAALPAGSYEIYVFAFDKAGNMGTISSNFSIDQTAPTITISTPATGSSLTSGLLQIGGTAADNAGGSGIANVKLGLRRNSDKLYWTIDGWGAKDQQIPIDTLQGTTWKKTTAMPRGAALLPGSYSIYAFAFDQAGNMGSTSSTFRVDSSR